MLQIGFLDHRPRELHGSGLGRGAGKGPGKGVGTSAQWNSGSSGFGGGSGGGGGGASTGGGGRDGRGWGGGYGGSASAGLKTGEGLARYGQNSSSSSNSSSSNAYRQPLPPSIGCSSNRSNGKYSDSNGKYNSNNNSNSNNNNNCGGGGVPPTVAAFSASAITAFSSSSAAAASSSSSSSSSAAVSSSSSTSSPSPGSYFVAVYDLPPGQLEKDQIFRRKEEERWAREGIDPSKLSLQGVLREGTLGGMGRHAIGRELGRFPIVIGGSQGLKFDIKNVKSSMQKYFKDMKWNTQSINILEVSYPTLT